MAPVLLLVVAACVVILICISKKRKALDKPVDVKPPVSSGTSDSASSIAGGTQSKSVEEKHSNSPQNTIYEFDAKSAKRLCPFCDGENSVGAKTCNICGRDL